MAKYETYIRYLQRSCCIILCLLLPCICLRSSLYSTTAVISCLPPSSSAPPPHPVDDVSHHVTLLQALVRPCAFRCPASVADCCFLPPLSPPLVAVIGGPVLWSQQGGVGNFPSPSQLSRSSSSTLRSLLKLVAVTGYWLPPPSTSIVMMQCAPKMVVSNMSKDDGPEYILCKQGDAKNGGCLPPPVLTCPPQPVLILVDCIVIVRPHLRCHEPCLFISSSLFSSSPSPPY